MRFGVSRFGISSLIGLGVWASVPKGVGWKIWV